MSDDKPGKAITPFVMPRNFGASGAPEHRAKSVRIRQIRDKLTTLMDSPVACGCVPCAVFLEVDVSTDCPGCAKPFIKFAPGMTRESLFLESMWRTAAMEPNGSAARLLMEYRYGRVPIAIRSTNESNEGTSKTVIKLTVVERKQETEPMPQLLEKTR